MGNPRRAQATRPLEARGNFIPALPPLVGGGTTQSLEAGIGERQVTALIHDLQSLRTAVRVWLWSASPSAMATE